MKHVARALLIFGAFAVTSVSVLGQGERPVGSQPPSQTSTDARAMPSPSLPERTSVAARTRQIAAEATRRALKQTEIYKVAPGDVLFITIANTTNSSGYYTVRQDGTIDFPLAGASPVVEGSTLDEIEDALASRITIFTDPLVNVKVRAFGSHKIRVSGLVEQNGERSLPREALPLFVVRADASVRPSATKVAIRRNEFSRPEFYALNDPATDEVLVYPGNTVEFLSDDAGSSSSSQSFFYIAGEVNLVGQRQLVNGMTLMQAVLAAGGSKPGAKKAIIRRKGERGLLRVTEYDVKKIRDGKIADPTLEAGDMIEVTN